jgi:hypothetical protein
MHTVDVHEAYKLAEEHLWFDQSKKLATIAPVAPLDKKKSLQSKRGTFNQEAKIF